MQGEAMLEVRAMVALAVSALLIAVGGCSGAHLTAKQRAEMERRAERQRRAELRRAFKEKSLAEQERLVEKRKKRQEKEQRRLAQIEREREERERREMEEAERLRRGEEARRQAAIEAVNRRLANLEFTDWSGACEMSDFLMVLPSACAELEGTYLQKKCEQRRKKAIKSKQVYSLRALVLVEYEGAKQRFKVTVPNLFYADTAIPPDECWRGCYGAWVSRKSLRVSGGKANFMGWLKRFVKSATRHTKAFKTVYVPESSVADLESIEKNLRAVALVRVVDVHGVYVGEWFNVTNVQVKVVGLRIGLLPDFQWGSVLVKYEKGVPSCADWLKEED